MKSGTAYRDEFPVTRTCKELAVLPSGYYYAWHERPLSVQGMANQKLCKKIKVVYNRTYEVHGTPRIYRELKDQGAACSENRLAHLMRLRGPQAKQTNRFKITKKRNRARSAAPNLLKEEMLRGNAF